ncbi:MAG: PLP-dependent aminotransferase family protein [Gemmataceae bacterium]
MTAAYHLSQRARQTKDQPISYFMRHALENPDLISLAAGFVDAASLPGAEVLAAAEQLLPGAAATALQYGTTQGYAPLRDKIHDHLLRLDGAGSHAFDADDIVVTTGSQQLLYLLGEMLFDPGDIIITEAPSYFVYHGVGASLGARALQVPMDEHGMDTDALEALLRRLERSGELDRVRLIYTVDYFQNPTGLTLSLPRRRHLVELARRFSRKHRLLILEDAAYRELRFAGPDLPSIKSLDQNNEHVILAMTFSKPLAPGFKTGYGVLPTDLVGPLLRFKGAHDFGSANLSQCLIDRLMENGAYERHVQALVEVYRNKRDVFTEALAEEFGADGEQGFRWTQADGGIYVWFANTQGGDLGPESPFMKACLEEGVLYVPGQFCYVDEPGRAIPRHEARLCFGVATPEQLREAARRLARAAARAGMALESVG